MKWSFFALGIAIVTIFTQCGTLKSLPTNTSGGLFSLNGTWQLISSNDNRALEGTVVSVVPGFSNATVRTISNNTYCVREGDAIWQNVKSKESGVFSLEILVDACKGTPLYKQATLTVLSNDEVRVGGSTAASADLIQSWKRVNK